MTLSNAHLPPLLAVESGDVEHFIFVWLFSSNRHLLPGMVSHPEQCAAKYCCPISSSSPLSHPQRRLRLPVPCYEVATAGIHRSQCLPSHMCLEKPSKRPR